MVRRGLALSLILALAAACQQAPAHAGEVANGYDGGQGGILDEVDEFVAAAGQRAADGLGQQDGDHRPGSAEPEAARGLKQTYSELEEALRAETRRATGT